MWLVRPHFKSQELLGDGSRQVGLCESFCRNYWMTGKPSFESFRAVNQSSTSGLPTTLQVAMLLSKDATETAFKKEPLDQFRVLHLAVHGFADTQYPERSALVLGADPESSDDGLLQVREIIRLRLNAELTTLSACDTGVGKLQGQEGISNLVEAFLVAGSKSVVASLWSADDTFASALMEQGDVGNIRLPAQSAPLRIVQDDLKQDEVLLEYVLDDPNSYCVSFVQARPRRRSYSTSLSRSCSRSAALPLCINRVWSPDTSVSKEAVCSDSDVGNAFRSSRAQARVRPLTRSNTRNASRTSPPRVTSSKCCT